MRWTDNPIPGTAIHPSSRTEARWLGPGAALDSRPSTIHGPARHRSYNPASASLGGENPECPLTTAPQTLLRPVEYGDIQLAPTTELAGLAELGTVYDLDERIEVLLRVARAIAAEDTERDRISALRDPSRTPETLPSRR